MLEFTNKKYESLLSIKFNKLVSKFNKMVKLNNNKILDLYNKELNKLKIQISSQENLKDYSLVSNQQYNKLIAEIFICIIKQYTTTNNVKPNIIISYNIDSSIISICKQLLKADIIELTILSNDDLISDIKKNKKTNTIIIIINPINNNLVYDVKSISRFCKYYNILLMTTIIDELYNYSNSNYLINNQDILLLNYNKYIIANTKNKEYKSYFLLIKNKCIQKYKLVDLIQKYNNINNMNYLIQLVINLSDINSKFINNNLSKIEELYKYFINKLRDNYRLINYYDLITNKKHNNIKYFINTVSIVLLNSNENFLFNNIYLSIYNPNINFTNKSILEYFKSYKIILSQAHKNVLNNSLLMNNYEYNNKLKNGLLHIQINLYTKISDLDKLFTVIQSFINSHILQQSQKSKKKTKFVHFSTPEFIICKKIHNPNTKPKLISSILKK